MQAVSQSLLLTFPLLLQVSLLVGGGRGLISAPQPPAQHLCEVKFSQHSKERKRELTTKGTPIQSGYISEKGGYQADNLSFTLECSRTRNALCLELRGEAENETKVSQHLGAGFAEEGQKLGTSEHHTGCTSKAGGTWRMFQMEQRTGAV